MPDTQNKYVSVLHAFFKNISPISDTPTLAFVLTNNRTEKDQELGLKVILKDEASAKALTAALLKYQLGSAHNPQHPKSVRSTEDKSEWVFVLYENELPKLIALPEFQIIAKDAGLKPESFIIGMLSSLKEEGQLSQEIASYAATINFFSGRMSLAPSTTQTIEKPQNPLTLAEALYKIRTHYIPSSKGFRIEPEKNGNLRIYGIDGATDKSIYALAKALKTHMRITDNNGKAEICAIDDSNIPYFPLAAHHVEKVLAHAGSLTDIALSHARTDEALNNNNAVSFSPAVLKVQNVYTQLLGEFIAGIGASDAKHLSGKMKNNVYMPVDFRFVLAGDNENIYLHVVFSEAEYASVSIEQLKKHGLSKALIKTADGKPTMALSREDIVFLARAGLDNLLKNARQHPEAYSGSTSLEALTSGSFFHYMLHSFREAGHLSKDVDAFYPAWYANHIRSYILGRFKESFFYTSEATVLPGLSETPQFAFVKEEDGFLYLRMVFKREEQAALLIKHFHQTSASDGKEKTSFPLKTYALITNSLGKPAGAYVSFSSYELQSLTRSGDMVHLFKELLEAHRRAGYLHGITAADINNWKECNTYDSSRLQVGFTYVADHVGQLEQFRFLSKHRPVFAFIHRVFEQMLQAYRGDTPDKMKAFLSIAEEASPLLPAIDSRLFHYFATASMLRIRDLETDTLLSLQSLQPDFMMKDPVTKVNIVKEKAQELVTRNKDLETFCMDMISMLSSETALFFASCKDPVIQTKAAFRVIVQLFEKLAQPEPNPALQQPSQDLFRQTRLFTNSVIKSAGQALEAVAASTHYSTLFLFSTPSKTLLESITHEPKRITISFGSSKEGKKARNAFYNENQYIFKALEEKEIGLKVDHTIGRSVPLAERFSLNPELDAAEKKTNAVTKFLHSANKRASTLITTLDDKVKAPYSITISMDNLKCKDHFAAIKEALPAYVRAQGMHRSYASNVSNSN